MKTEAILALTLFAVPVPGVHAQEVIGDFVYFVNVDAMTDADESYIATPEDDRSPLESASLAWGCNSSSVINLVVLVGDFVGSDGQVNVQWRFDRDPPSATHRWEILASTTVVAPRASLVEFTAGARSASQVTVRVTDYEGADHDAVFSLDGLTTALSRLSCTPMIESIAQDLEEEAREAAEMEAAIEAASPAFPDDIVYVGNPDNKRYAPAVGTCWRLVVGPDRAVRFKSLAEAREQGFRPSSVCR